jgi:hypothetical protein
VKFSYEAVGTIQIAANNLSRSAAFSELIVPPTTSMVAVDCQTLESTTKTRGPWVIAVGDPSTPTRCYANNRLDSVAFLVAGTLEFPF